MFGNAFSSLLAEFTVKCAFFFLHLSVCHISLKSRPFQSDSRFLSPSVGLLQHIVHRITLEDHPVDLILCLFTFPSASCCTYFSLKQSFPSHVLVEEWKLTETSELSGPKFESFL